LHFHTFIVRKFFLILLFHFFELFNYFKIIFHNFISIIINQLQIILYIFIFLFYYLYILLKYFFFIFFKSNTIFIHHPKLFCAFESLCSTTFTHYLNIFFHFFKYYNYFHILSSNYIVYMQLFVLLT
jgi:hypothetical protein